VTKTVCIIPARGGSVRIPRKNIALFHGKPMLEWAIEKACNSLLFDEVVVSTDDNTIANLANALGVAVHWREPDDGQRGTQEVAREVLLEGRAGISCVLYPCTPLLHWRELIDGYKALLSRLDQMFVYSADEHGRDAGGFYWGFAAAFLQELPLSGPWPCVRVSEHFDINTPEDWARAEIRYRELHEPKVAA
jgi:N-acylneuraminate cytidylyltransferase